MAVYDFQEATANRIAEIFRNATIDADGHEIKRGGQRRVLLADEVGLGKTIIAREVISKVREMRREVGDDMFRVVYVCSNMNIVRQNIENLGVDEQLDVSESRLSMQHLVLAEKDQLLRKASPDSMPEMLIPLTPATSFSQRGSGIGNIPERALMAVVLAEMPEFEGSRKELYDFMRSHRVDSNSGSWHWNLERYSQRVMKLRPTYLSAMADKLHADLRYESVVKEIKSVIGGEGQFSPKIINDLRRIFADISLSMLEPDLIIMDEFQRFSSLLHTETDNEQTAIVKKFFGDTGGQQPMILLLSATPYKPLTTLEELNENNADEHYEDFNNLMDFLNERKGDFHEVWTDYSTKLMHLQSEDFDTLLVAKNRAEERMYGVMCRTERLSEGLLSAKKVGEMKIELPDVASFVEMQGIVTACREISEGRGRLHWQNMPVEYVKSAPYLLSFMDTYELKKQISALYERHGEKLPAPGKYSLLKASDLSNYHKIPLANARLKALKEEMLPSGQEAGLLLWVPASRPYYTFGGEGKKNPFVRNADFSKMLVFSSWEMVPRMVSALMTYEAEREVIFSQYKKTKYDAVTGGQRLKQVAKEIMTFPSHYLAGLYRPADWYGSTVEEIRRAVKGKIAYRLRGIPPSKWRSYAKILDVLRWLEDETLTRPTDMPAETLDLLTDMAIASPASCVIRLLGSDKYVRDIAEKFVTLFNQRIAGYVIDRMQHKYHNDELYLEGVMDYCVAGNLNAVLAEFAHMISPEGNEEKIARRICDSFIETSTLRIDTDESFGRPEGKKFGMRASYAVPFAAGKTSIDEKREKRNNNVRSAFQSPFYPFVLTTTSVGQEGLDFHWYCRKIMHWNLPSNPQDLEQREGRINRYKCLAIRRNLAQLEPEKFEMEEIFSSAAERVQQEFGTKYPQMVPYWSLPPEWIDKDKMEMIERIVGEYPMSADVERYRHLIEVLSLYRLTMGQPRQEELVEMLKRSRLTEEQMHELLFNLSPFFRNRKSDVR